MQSDHDVAAPPLMSFSRMDQASRPIINALIGHKLAEKASSRPMRLQEKAWRVSEVLLSPRDDRNYP